MKNSRKCRIIILSVLLMLAVLCIYPAGEAEAAQKKVYLSRTSVTLYVGQSKKLKVVNAKKTVKWSSSKKKVATVSSKGRVVAKKKGTATITAKVGKKKYKCKVVVKNPQLNKSTLTLNVNQTDNLSVLGTTDKVTWTSKNPQIVRVSKKGKIRGLKAGTTYVIAKVGKTKYKCRITVDDPGISASSVLLECGSTYQLSLRNTKRAGQWSSGNPSVASVSANGLIVTKARGTTVIYVIVGTKTCSCSVSVMGSRSSFKSISHRGYSPAEESGNCRLSAYASAKAHGFNYVEADIQFTLDEEPVCCHDATFQDGTTGQTITIAEHTLTELKTYNYYGESIASLDELISLCKTLGMGVYLDRPGNITKKSARITKVFGIIEKYGMKNAVTFLVNTENQAGKLLAQYPQASLSVLMSETRNLQYCITVANAVKTTMNTVSINCSHYRMTVDQLLASMGTVKAGITFEACTVNSVAAYKKYLPYVNGITSDKWSLNDFL